MCAMRNQTADMQITNLLVNTDMSSRQKVFLAAQEIFPAAKDILRGLENIHRGKIFPAAPKIFPVATNIASYVPPRLP